MRYTRSATVLAVALAIFVTDCRSGPELSAGAASRMARKPSNRKSFFPDGYPTPQTSSRLKQQLLFQRGVQSYLWAMPALNMYAMKEGSEKTFGKGYNVLPIWKKRLDAKTLITTPNSDVIYARGYLDLKRDGPLVIEAPPGLQGILDDFFQRPICSAATIEGREWCGDVGLPGPDKGKGGKYLILPPDYADRIPAGYFPFRSRTYGVFFVFWRGFFQDPKHLQTPVKVMEQTLIYLLGRKGSAEPMEFPDASGVPINMLPPGDAGAFDMLARFIGNEYVDPADMDMRGMLAAIGIVKGQPFTPDAHARAILDRAAQRGSEMARYTVFEVTATLPGGRYYPDRQYINGFPPLIAPNFAAPASAPTYTQIETRSGFFAIAYSASPAISLPDMVAKYPTAFKDADAEYLSGNRSYRMHLPAGIPARLFWSVTVYDSETSSGLNNGQRFPSVNAMDRPVTNPDGSTDIYFGPTSPGPGKNWLATLPEKGFFTILRLYAPTKAFYDQTWKPGDLEKVK